MYKTLHCLVHDIPSVFNSICLFVESIEWILIDNISSTSKVYSIPGETNHNDNLYVHFLINTTTITCYVYVNWNIVSHTGIHSLNVLTVFSRSYVNYTGPQNETSLFFAGNKDFMFMSNLLIQGGVLIQSGSIGVGFIPNIIYSIKKESTLPIVAGSNIQITLDGSVNIEELKINGVYQIIDRTRVLGGEKVTISNIDYDNKIVTIPTLTISYPNGVYLGINIFNSFVFSSDYLMDLWSWTRSGTTANSYNYRLNDILYGHNGSSAPTTGTILETQYGNNLLNIPFIMKYHGVSPVGYFNEEIKEWRASVSRTIIKTFLAYNNDNSNVKNNYSYPTSLSSSLNYLEDIRKNWVVDSLIGKYVCFGAGTGAWQTRKIQSNTINRIYFEHDLIDEIGCDSLYFIADKVYRVLNHTGGGSDNGSLVVLDTY